MGRVDELISERPICSREEIWSDSKLLLPEPGVYAWFFDEIPPSVPRQGLFRRKEGALLYVGISPKPPSNDGKNSRQSVRSRIRYHFRGNAYGSTLRKTLGCLLSGQLGIQLKPVGKSGTRITFGAEGENALSEWMAAHARVSWLLHPEPWIVEDEAIDRLNLPLNLKGNEQHPFYSHLTQIRKIATQRARES
ncbi:GIY-YIG nuclease family protein [Elusimicrobiota bacterium]